MNILYHYSNKAYKTLLNRRLQGGLTQADIDDAEQAAQFRGSPGPYVDHVSLFLEPPPLDILPDIYPDDHHTWVKGNTLIEHRVNVDTIDLYAWEVAEAPIHVFMYRYLPWFDIDAYKKLFFRVRTFGDHVSQVRGSDSESLKRYLARYKPGTTRAAYERMRRKPLEEDAQYKYAATVPHLMVYTHHPIPVRSTQKVKVGQSTESHKTPSTESLLSRNW